MKTLTTAAAALALATPALAQVPVPGQEPADEIALISGESEVYGDYLATARGRGTTGRPVYIFTADTQRTGDQEARISCTSTQCLDLWPLVTGGVVDTEEDVDLDLVGTIAYENRQVTLYNGWPLYHFNQDQAPLSDEPQGHGRESYGGVWLLIAPSGEPIAPVP